MASLFKMSTAENEINNSISNSSNGKYEMNYKLFSFNFKIPKRGWSNLNELMYEINDDYKKSIQSGLINDNICSIPLIQNSVSVSNHIYSGKLSLYYNVLKNNETDEFDFAGGFNNYDSVNIEISWIGKFVTSTLFHLYSPENITLNTLFKFENGSLIASSYIDGLYFDVLIHGIKHNVIIPKFEVIASGSVNVSGLNIYAYEQPSSWLNKNDVNKSPNNALRNYGIRYFNDINSDPADIAVDLISITSGQNPIESRILHPDFYWGNIDQTNEKPFIYPVNDLPYLSGVDSLAAAYAYQNMSSCSEKNICGYFKTWIPLASIRFTPPDIITEFSNSVRGFNVAERFFYTISSNNRKRSASYEKGIKLSWKNPTRGTYVGSNKGFSHSILVRRTDHFPTSFLPSNDQIIIELDQDGNRLSGYGKSCIVYDTNVEHNTWYYYRVFYIDAAGQSTTLDVEEDEASCLKTGLFIPEPPNISLFSVNIRKKEDRKLFN